MTLCNVMYRGTQIITDRKLTDRQISLSIVLYNLTNFAQELCTGLVHSNLIDLTETVRNFLDP